MNREEMQRRACGPEAGWTAWDICEALNAALDELGRVGDALGTAETDDALVAVASAAHEAEQARAADEEALEGMALALYEQAPDEPVTPAQLEQKLQDELEELEKQVKSLGQRAGTAEDLVGRMRSALQVHAIMTVFCGGCGVRYQECGICGAVVASRGDGFEPVECDGHEVEGHKSGCLLAG